jgi:Mn-dependent DtxR family transcriptional regulator
VTSDRELQMLEVLSNSLQAGESLSIREIAGRVGLSVGATHSYIMRAESEGLVERDPKTRRVVRLNTTGLASLSQRVPKKRGRRDVDKRRQEILRYMADAHESGKQASIRELALDTKSAPSTIASDLKALLQDGYVYNQAYRGSGSRGLARAYRLTSDGFARARASSELGLPVSGIVAAGQPIEIRSFERSNYDLSYQLVLLRHPPSAPKVDEETLGRLQKEHILYQRSLRNVGDVLLAGSEQTDEKLREVYLYHVGSLEAARRLAEQDPLVRAGLLDVDLVMWLSN